MKRCIAFIIVIIETKVITYSLRPFYLQKLFHLGAVVLLQMWEIFESENWPKLRQGLPTRVQVQAHPHQRGGHALQWRIYRTRTISHPLHHIHPMLTLWRKKALQALPIKLQLDIQTQRFMPHDDPQTIFWSPICDRGDQQTQYIYFMRKYLLMQTVPGEILETNFISAIMGSARHWPLPRLCAVVSMVGHFQVTVMQWDKLNVFQ